VDGYCWPLSCSAVFGGGLHLGKRKMAGVPAVEDKRPPWHTVLYYTVVQTMSSRCMARSRTCLGERRMAASGLRRRTGAMA